VLGDATSEDALGRRFGGDLYEREVRYLMQHEWARCAADVLWRRSKQGLKFSAEETSGLDEWMQGQWPLAASL
jgi:glycerol-3-phosphate dehydrogenase